MTGIVVTDPKMGATDFEQDSKQGRKSDKMKILA
jgi:hypothetical protein